MMRLGKKTLTTEAQRPEVYLFLKHQNVFLRVLCASVVH